MLSAAIEKNDKKAYWLIGIFSVIVFVAVSFLGKIDAQFAPGFDIHIFAKINALVNTAVALLLVWALIAVRNRKLIMHRNLMMGAMGLSILFLVSYIAHHLFAGEARFGDYNQDGIVSAEEKLRAGATRIFYLVLLITHIILAAFILPFILLTAYRALTGEWQAHRKLAKYTWPLWFYVAVTGPIIYLMISPFYT